MQQCRVSDNKGGKSFLETIPKDDVDKSLFVGVTRVIINHSIKNVVGYFIHDVGGENSVHRRVLHSLLFLPLIAEPHSNHVLFQVQFLSDSRDFLRGGPRLDGEVRLQGALLRRGDGRALPFPLTAVEKVRLAALLPVRSLCFLQPGL